MIAVVPALEVIGSLVVEGAGLFVETIGSSVTGSTVFGVVVSMASVVGGADISVVELTGLPVLETSRSALVEATVFAGVGELDSCVVEKVTEVETTVSLEDEEGSWVVEFDTSFEVDPLVSFAVEGLSVAGSVGFPSVTCPFVAESAGVSGVEDT